WDALRGRGPRLVPPPADGSAIAAVRPAGPAPTIATCAVKLVMPLSPSKSYPLRSSLWPQHVLAKARANGSDDSDLANLTRSRVGAPLPSAARSRGMTTDSKTV